MSEYRKCDRCGKMKPNVDREPALKWLIFGGFMPFMENRCRACERKVCRTVDRLMKQAGATP